MRHLAHFAQSERRRIGNFGQKFARRIFALFAVAQNLGLMPERSGGEFLPQMNEGDLLYMPSALPGLSAAEAGRLSMMLEEAVATLRAADKLFAIDPAARCTPASVDLVSATLKVGTAAPAKDDGHGDLEGTFTFQCQAVPAFVDAGLFQAFPRLSRIDVQVAAPKGQHKQVLKRPAQRIALPR